MEIGSLVEQTRVTCDSSATPASIRSRVIEEEFVVVADRGRFLGLLTPEDLLRSEGGSLADCLRETPGIEETDDLGEVLRRMDEARTHVLPVFRNDRFLGVVRRQRIAACLLERCERLEQEARQQGQEQAACESERRYRRLIETAQDGICVIDFSGRLVECNDSFCRIVGYSPSELRRMTISDLEAVESPEQVLLHIHRVNQLKTDRFETKHRRKDGTLIDVEVAATVLDPQDGRFFIFVRDTTEHKRIEARIKERETTLLHAARLSTLGEMASGIAHELNQPLSAILSYSDACLSLSEAKPPDIPRIVRNLGEIISQGERAGVIIRRMRALAKGRQPCCSCADLNDMVRNAVALVRWELSQNGVQLELELAESLPLVYADSIQIEQVLLNLIRNAIDAMRHTTGEPRKLTLRTKALRDDQVCGEVCDTGVGLSQTQTERLFEPFFTTKPDGLGIGLSISRTIIEGHKGILEARPNVGAGAVFSFTLPVCQAPG
jgi:PAS domain S-box-containing protein